MIARMILALLIAAAPLSALGQTKGSPSFGTVRADQFIGPLQGNATSATTAATVGALATPRTLTLSGDAACSFLFDGSANTGCTLTLAASGVTAGTYGSASAVPVVTVDAKGRITGISTTPVSGGGGGAVSSVAGRTGAVTLTSADLTDGTSLGRSVFTAASASAARSSLGAAESGANSSITSLTGLTTALPITEGGTGATTASAARSALGAAASGANADITSLQAGVTGTTAAANDNSTKFATTGYADRAATNAANAATQISGAVVSSARAQSAILGSTSVQTPITDTPPTTSNTTAISALSVTITPKAATNKLRVRAVVQGSLSTTGAFVGAIFQGSGTSAVAANYVSLAGGYGGEVVVTYETVAGGVSAITFSVSVGTNNSASLTINGTAGARLFGGVMFSSLEVTEVLP